MRLASRLAGSPKRDHDGNDDDDGDEKGYDDSRSDNRHRPDGATPPPPPLELPPRDRSPTPPPGSSPSHSSNSKQPTTSATATSSTSGKHSHRTGTSRTTSNSTTSGTVTTADASSSVSTTGKALSTTADDGSGKNNDSNANDGPTAAHADADDDGAADAVADGGSIQSTLVAAMTLFYKLAFGDAVRESDSPGVISSKATLVALTLLVGPCSLVSSAAAAAVYSYSSAWSSTAVATTSSTAATAAIVRNGTTSSPTSSVISSVDTAAVSLASYLFVALDAALWLLFCVPLYAYLLRKRRLDAIDVWTPSLVAARSVLHLAATATAIGLQYQGYNRMYGVPLILVVCSYMLRNESIGRLLVCLNVVDVVLCQLHYDTYVLAPAKLTTSAAFTFYVATDIANIISCTALGMTACYFARLMRVSSHRHARTWRTLNAVCDAINKFDNDAVEQIRKKYERQCGVVEVAQSVPQPGRTDAANHLVGSNVNPSASASGRYRRGMLTVPGANSNNPNAVNAENDDMGTSRSGHSVTGAPRVSARLYSAVNGKLRTWTTNVGRVSSRLRGGGGGSSSSRPAFDDDDAGGVTPSDRNRNGAGGSSVANIISTKVGSELYDARVSSMATRVAEAIAKYRVYFPNYVNLALAQKQQSETMATATTTTLNGGVVSIVTTAPSPTKGNNGANAAAAGGAPTEDEAPPSHHVTIELPTTASTTVSHSIHPQQRHQQQQRNMIDRTAPQRGDAEEAYSSDGEGDTPNAPAAVRRDTMSPQTNSVVLPTNAESDDAAAVADDGDDVTSAAVSSLATRDPSTTPDHHHNASKQQSRDHTAVRNAPAGSPSSKASASVAKANKNAVENNAHTNIPTATTATTTAAAPPTWYLNGVINLRSTPFEGDISICHSHIRPSNLAAVDARGVAYYDALAADIIEFAGQHGAGIHSFIGDKLVTTFNATTKLRNPAAACCSFMLALDSLRFDKVSTSRARQQTPHEGGEDSMENSTNNDQQLSRRRRLVVAATSDGVAAHAPTDDFRSGRTPRRTAAPSPPRGGLGTANSRGGSLSERPTSRGTGRYTPSVEIVSVAATGSARVVFAGPQSKQVVLCIYASWLDRLRELKLFAKDLNANLMLDKATRDAAVYEFSTRGVAFLGDEHNASNPGPSITTPEGGASAVAPPTSAPAGFAPLLLPLTSNTAVNNNNSTNSNNYYAQPSPPPAFPSFGGTGNGTPIAKSSMVFELVAARRKRVDWQDAAVMSAMDANEKVTKSLIMLAEGRADIAMREFEDIPENEPILKELSVCHVKSRLERARGNLSAGLNSNGSRTNPT